MLAGIMGLGKTTYNKKNPWTGLVLSWIQLNSNRARQTFAAFEGSARGFGYASLGVVHIGRRASVNKPWTVAFVQRPLLL